MTAAADTTHGDRGSIPVSQQFTSRSEQEPMTVLQPPAPGPGDETTFDDEFSEVGNDAFEQAPLH